MPLKKHITLIWNEQAGSSSNKKIIRQTKHYFERRDYLVESFSPKSGQETTDIAYVLAEKAADSNYKEIIVPIGGEGTIYDVVNGLFRYSETCKFDLGIISTGTGNVFAQNIGLLTASDKLVADTIFYPMPKFYNRIMRGRTRKIDIGKLTSNDIKYFVSWAGFDFSSEIVLNVKPLAKKVFKEGAFIASFFVKLMSYVPKRTKVITDPATSHQKEFTAYALDIVKNRLMGGKRLVYVPDAKHDDGYLHVVLAKEKNLAKIVTDTLGRHPEIIGRLEIKGQVLDHPAVEYVKAKRVTVIPEEYLSAHCDAETYEIKKGQEVNIELLPRALRVIY